MMPYKGREIQLNRTSVLLSVQRALLGAITNAIQAVCVNIDQMTIDIHVYTETSLSDIEKEEFEVVSSEVWADFNSKTIVNIKFLENVNQPYIDTGTWVFLRYGCLIKQPEHNI